MVEADLSSVTVVRTHVAAHDGRQIHGVSASNTRYCSSARDDFHSEINIWNLESGLCDMIITRVVSYVMVGDLVARLPSQDDGVLRLSFLHNNEDVVIASSGRGYVYIWDIASQTLTSTFNARSFGLNGLGISDDDETIVVFVCTVTTHIITPCV